MRNNCSLANIGRRFHRWTNGELDWAMTEDEEMWRDLDETLSSADTFILGCIPPTNKRCIHNTG